MESQPRGEILGPVAASLKRWHCGEGLGLCSLAPGQNCGGCYREAVTVLLTERKAYPEVPTTGRVDLGTVLLWAPEGVQGETRVNWDKEQHATHQKLLSNISFRYVHICMSLCILGICILG